MLTIPFFLKFINIAIHHNSRSIFTHTYIFFEQCGSLATSSFFAFREPDFLPFFSTLINDLVIFHRNLVNNFLVDVMKGVKHKFFLRIMGCSEPFKNQRKIIFTKLTIAVLKFFPKNNGHIVLLWLLLRPPLCSLLRLYWRLTVLITFMTNLLLFCEDGHTFIIYRSGLS